MQAERSVAVHLAWEGLERVDSTVGELFGTIISVLGASTGTELGASTGTELDDLVVVVKLDNKGVVDHYDGGGNDMTIRQRLKQHARALWNVLHHLVRKRKAKVVFTWLRANHNQLSTEQCDDGEGNELVDSEARRALEAGSASGTVDWQQGDEVAIGRDGMARKGWAWHLGEEEVAIYLKGEDGRHLPVTSQIRRSVIRLGLQRERIQKWAECRASGETARKLVKGIADGSLRVLGSKAGAWGASMENPAELAVCVSALQGESVDVAPSRTAKGRSYRQAMRVTRAGQEGTCVFCGEKFGQRHVLVCPEWAA